MNTSIYLTDFYINKFASKNPHADVIRMDVSGKFKGKMSITKGEPDDFLGLNNFLIDYSSFYYLNQTNADTVEILGLKLDLDYAAINVTNGDKILANLDVMGIFSSRQLLVNDFKYSNLLTSVEGKSGKLRLTKNQIELFGIVGEMLVDADFTDEVYTYRIEQNAKGHDINHILDTVTDTDLVDGSLDISIWLEMSGNSWQENMKTLRGEVNNRGKDLRIRNVDLDAVISNFKDTQNFNLLDVGAIVFAGPAGAVVTKSVDYAKLLQMNPGDSTVITDFITEIKLNDGMAHIQDMAFNTQRSRIAFDGVFDLANLSFVNFVIAIVNTNGCILLSQQLNGPFGEPKLEKFSTIGTILAPIRNAYNSIVGNECTPFYSGAIAHPN
jgi:AsmA protein